MLIFDVASLKESATGANMSFSFEGPAEFAEFKLKSNLKGGIDIMKMEDGFLVSVHDLESTTPAKCEKCLKPLAVPLKIRSFDRQFFIEKPAEVEDLYDVFLVNSKNMSIDISELLRQEIILHFPPKIVCSSGCKGVCPHCGIDRNKKQCDCKDENPAEDSKPLAALKDLIK